MKALTLLIVALCAVAPLRWVVACLPALWIFQRLLPAETGVLAHLGGTELSPADIVIVLLAVRTAVNLVRRKELTLDRGLFVALGVYLVVMLLASFAAGLKFGEGQLMRCTVSWTRFVSELLVLPIAAQAIRDTGSLRLAIRVLLGTLAMVALIQFVNYAGASRGIIIGEVQGIERGELRYFGPIGDSVGVVLLLGYVASLCYANVPGAALFLGGIVLTAGVGALLATAVATALFVVLGTRTPAVQRFLRQYISAVPLVLLIAVMAAVVLAKPLTETLFSRFTTKSYESSGAQRSASAQLAGAMFTDNPILGVGYMGYERALERYGGGKYFDLEHPDGATANANNQLLQSLADGGLLGLAAFLLLIAASTRLLLRLARCGDPLIGTFFLAAAIWLLAQLFGNLAAVWLNPSAFVARFLWVILGLATAAGRLLPVAGPLPANSKVRGPEPALAST